jgi:hypothetical protein
MAKWWKRLALVGLGLAGSAQAQHPLPGWTGPPPTAATHAEPAPLGFSGIPGPSAHPQSPMPAPHESTPISLSRDGQPNAFEEDPRPAGEEPLRWWLRGEYLYYRISRERVPIVIATTSLAPDILTDFGAIGQENTQNLYGPTEIDFGRIPGGRVTLGIAPQFMPPLEITGFSIQRDLTPFREESTGTGLSAVLARPVLATQLPAQLDIGQETVFLAAFPGIASGSINVDATTNLWGVELNFFCPICCSDCLSVDFILGYRHADLKEDLAITNTIRVLDPSLAIAFAGDPAGFGVGHGTVVIDDFRTRSIFEGAQIGVRTLLNVSCWDFMMDAKFAVGNTSQTLDIQGSSNLLTPSAPIRGGVPLPDGILAVASNRGRHVSDDISIIPEVNVSMGVNLSRCLRVSIGYNILYWSSVTRPGDQLSDRVDTRQAPTDFNFVRGFRGADPVAPFRQTDLFLHGISVGLTIGY